MGSALTEASRVRQLAATAPVRGVELSRTEMAEHVTATIQREVPPAVLRDEGEMLIALGVAPPSFDYMKAMVSLMSAELAGYYEPADKTMYLSADLSPSDRAATLAHELVHALQDQHYDLGKALDYRADESDAQSALHALAEGDATSAMLDQMLAPKGAKATDLSDTLLGIQVRAAAQFTNLADVPGILKRSLVAPYVDGIEFVHWLRRRGGWAAVDAAWRSPPVSTEQLLHPEKYLARESPVVVPVPVAPEGFTKPCYTDVFGEESVELLLEEWVPRKTAVEAASDWGGDRVAVFREPVAGDRGAERIAVGWHLRYDTDGAAVRGERALARGVVTQSAAGPGAATLASRCVDRATVGPIFVQRRGRDIAVVAGPYTRRPSGDASAGTCGDAEKWANRVLLQR